MTPLSYAVKYNFFNIMVTLLKHDALVEKRAFKDVPKNECTNFLEKIVKCCDFVYSDDITGLKNELDDIEDNSVLNVIVNVKINIQRTKGNDNGQTLLHLAAIANEEKVVTWLIKDKGADPYLTDC
uniref:Uncharacterized protein n=1 Tax=Panagrolaimus davidi TaxID=227884 RepID=A0A914Q1I3_9BILA